MKTTTEILSVETIKNRVSSNAIVVQDDGSFTLSPQEHIEFLDNLLCGFPPKEIIIWDDYRENSIVYNRVAVEMLTDTEKQSEYYYDIAGEFFFHVAFGEDVGEYFSLADIMENGVLPRVRERIFCNVFVVHTIRTECIHKINGYLGTLSSYSG